MLSIHRRGSRAQQYGLGASTGIDLPGEVTATVLTNRWKLNTLRQPWPHGGRAANSKRPRSFAR